MIQKSLYHPDYEHDACGVGLLVDIHGKKTHDIVEKGLQVLENMVHRGAESADNKTGDGAGIMLQIPHEFILLQGIPVPEKGRYGTGLVFLPKDEEQAVSCMKVIESVLNQEGLLLLAVRDVPVCSDVLGEISRGNEPTIKQVFVVESEKVKSEELRIKNENADILTLELKLYIARKKIEKKILKSAIPDRRSFYVVSLSTQRIVYKGMLTSTQIGRAHV